MTSKRRTAVSLALACSLALTLTACGNSNDGNDSKGNASNGKTTNTADNTAANSQNNAASADPMAPYKDTVEYTTVRSISQDPKFPEGQSYEKNDWQDYVEKTLNVKGKMLWMAPSDGDQYAKKLSLDVASNHLPDIFYIEGQNAISMLNTLVDSELIEDLTPYYDKYASQKVKDRYSANPYAFTTSDFGGKRMALPYGMEKEQPMLVWVREDWRKKLNLPEPKTIDDIRKISMAFTTQDPDGNKKNDTLGLVAQSNSMYSPSFDLHTLDSIYWSENAFPATWEKNADGKVQYGGIQPEAKKALGILRDMYKEGSIDKEYGLKDGGKTTEDVSSGRAGMVFEAWYAPYYPLGNTINNDPHAEWKAYALLSEDGKLNVGSSPTPGGFVVVRKGFEHPELAIQLMNLSTEFADKSIPELKPVYEKYDKAVTVAVAKHAQYVDLSIADPAAIYNQQKKYDDILAGKADESILLENEKGGLDQIKAEMKTPLETVLAGNPDKDTLSAAISNHIGYLAYMNAMNVVTKNESNIVVTPNVYSGQTATMKTKWTDLQTLQKQAYLKIILGSESLDSFDKFVNDWKAKGGDQITQEIQAELDKHN
ncbi:type 2 periplasmic-binding domain-containing protein [Paenibacillus albus]|uniref:ABC transporter substrate-binding protein n=1 Tax=Paenibacillus albus TaxID=2495582 RepID=A0A3S9A3N2_9BACL|nr:ABC transporter substrate-binding protein [Paenibacillus albus]AZN40321.1 ABC transporter substrate-binding protein [Paenibacillus albus]